jgi:hypothetical protein
MTEPINLLNGHIEFQTLLHSLKYTQIHAAIDTDTKVVSAI